jgi:hypothetical protein
METMFETAQRHHSRCESNLLPLMLVAGVIIPTFL